MKILITTAGNCAIITTGPPTEIMKNTQEMLAMADKLAAAAQVLYNEVEANGNSN